MSKGPSPSEIKECLHREVSKYDYQDPVADIAKLKKAMDQCSASKTRIIGGHYTAFREYPWLVSLELFDKFTTSYYPYS